MTTDLLEKAAVTNPIPTIGYRARRRFVLPPLWGMAVVLIIALVYTMCVISITASLTAERLDRDVNTSINTERRPPLLKLQPADWLYKQ
jgi:hypothetical protein